jgi:hypothetical protein
MHGQAAPRDATPMDAIPAILDLFKSHQVVGLGEGPHGNLEGAAFRLSLVRDPRFPSVVNDILVESGTGRYQDLMDRYIRGEAVPREQLRKTWEDTTNPGTNWEKPMYEEFFTAVRTVNATLPPGGKLRVLLGDPPIAWESVRTRADLRRWNMQRDAHAFAVLKRESLTQNRKALVIYGDGHFQGRGFTANSPGWNTVLMEDQFDGVVYLGAGRPTMTLMPASLCVDPAYMKMRRDWQSSASRASMRSPNCVPI